MQKKTSGISGLTFSPSSPSADLQRSLVNKLAARLDGGGSMLFDFSWKEWDTESGVPISALRARARRTSDLDSTSGPTHWPTTTKMDAHSSARHGYMIKGKDGTTLLDAVRMVTPTSWPTPGALHRSGALQGSQEKARERQLQGHHVNLDDAACLVVTKAAPWATPTVRDHKDGASDGTVPTNSLLGREVWLAKKAAPWATPVATEIGNTLENYRAMKANMRAGKRTAITHPSLQAQLVATPPTPPSGATTSGSPASGSTASTTATVPTKLNPSHSRWLMGLPPIWDELGACVAMEMRSLPRSRKRSSKRAKKHGRSKK